MNDIVEWLRLSAKHPHNQHGPHEQLAEAAAEIERLRAALEEIAAAYNDPYLIAEASALTMYEAARAALNHKGWEG